MHKDLRLCNYDYFLPKELIANYPASTKEDARLLVYERKKDRITHSFFGELSDFLPSCAIFFNDTKVIKARILGTKTGGARSELFLHQALTEFEFLAQIKGRVKVGEVLSFERGLKAEVLELLEDGRRRVRFKQDRILNRAKLYELLSHIGHIPLPPYIKRKDEPSDESAYQSVFAKNLGALAAPTAGLHFSKKMLELLRQKHDIYYLTLHIGAGTFKSVECENIREHQMHSEFFHIDEAAARVIQSQKPLLGVGTTTTRSIEYFFRTGVKSGDCDLFLHPFNKPLRLNHLLTNFHLPKSTLLMLVSSFIGREKTLELYKIAIEKKYRFYSYGDAMLIL